MAVVASHQVKPFVVPVNRGTGLVDANEIRGNDNTIRVKYVAHDADSSIHVQSGLHSARPATATDGSVWVSTDTLIPYIYTGGAWKPLDGWSSYSYHGAFHDDTDQTASAANTATLATLNTTDIVNGFTLVSGSQVRATYAGTYNVQFSVQLANADSQDHDVWLWLKKNGTNVADSGGRVTVVSKHGSIDGHVIAIWNVFLTLAANDYVQLYWETTNTACRIEHLAASGGHPAAPSIIFTVNRV